MAGFNDFKYIEKIRERLEELLKQKKITKKENEYLFIFAENIYYMDLSQSVLDETKKIIKRKFKNVYVSTMFDDKNFLQMTKKNVANTPNGLKIDSFLNSFIYMLNEI